MARHTWRTITLGDFVSLQRGYDLPAEARKSGWVPIMGSSGITGYHNESRAKGPGVTIGRSGVGSCGVVSYSPTDYWPHNTTLFVTDFHGNDERFTYYFLKSLDLRRYDSGSAQSSLNRNYIYPISITVPPPDEQRAIAFILGSLDDKIELNRQMNATLEAMARVLFKSWFVDFDPVHAKMAGRQPEGMDATTAALFPDRLVPSELGEVPEGWRVGKLGDVATARRDGVHPSEVTPETPYIGLEHMPRRSIALTDWGTSADVGSGKSRFNRGDILFGKLRPYFHKTGVAAVDGVCSTDIVVAAPVEPEWFSFTLAHMSSDAFVQYTDQHSAGTKMPRTNWGDMSRYPVVIPPTAVASAFNTYVSPFVDSILNNIHQSRTLAVIRDGLLPRLLSGDMKTNNYYEGAIL